MQTRLRYNGWSVAMQEVPGEISLVVNISGCPHRCAGCHSDYLWRDEGPFLSDDLESLLSKYPGLLTCVCFMGGDQCIEELEWLCGEVFRKGLKRCVYSGLPVTEAHRGLFERMKLEFYKLGEYRQELGGLDSPTTNQRFYKKEGGVYHDITEVFQRRGKP